MDEFEELVLELRAGAERRGLRLMEAMFPGEPAVVFQLETTSVDQILDLAQQTFAPFLTLMISRLDVADLVDSWDSEDDENPELPAQLLSRWQERAGQIDGVFVQWMASGTLYLYLAVPAWKHELEELSESWSEEQEAQRTDLYKAGRIRMMHLAELLESEPEYRGGTTHSRGSIGRTILEPKLQSNEDGYMVTLVLREASRLVRDNAQVEYSKLMGRLDELAVELSGTMGWQQVYTARDRTAVTRMFLIKQSGGYSPSTAMTNELRRLAEKAS